MWYLEAFKIWCVLVCKWTSHTDKDKDEDKDLSSNQTSFLNNENKQLNKVEKSKLILILMVQVPSTFKSCILQNTKSEICNHKLQDHS